MKTPQLGMLIFYFALVSLGSHSLQAATSVLPPLQYDKESVVLTLDRNMTVLITSHHIEGNTVVPDHEIERIVAPYLNQRIDYAKLSLLKDALTLAYVERGYISSGAVINRQTLPQGVLSIQIVEGELDAVNINNTGRLRDNYIRNRIQAHDNEVVNLIELEERLQILQQDSRIHTVQTQLSPAAQRGKSILNVSVQEARPYEFSMELSNFESPNVGAQRVLLSAVHNNVSGYGDTVELDYRKSEGLDAWHARYAFPFMSNGATIFLDAQSSDNAVVEDAFKVLDIESTSSTFKIGIDYPFYRSAHSLFSVFLTADKGESESFLLGLPFSFTEGIEDGVANVSAVRAGLRWNQRGRRRAIAIRSTISFGIDALDSTNNENDLPDSEFRKWVLQGQWAQRMDWLNSRVITRAQVQLTDSPLLGLERFALGGHSSVRGYRENTLSGDNGAVASVEWRIPVFAAWNGQPRLTVAPFVEAGRVWGDSSDVDARTLSSAGVSLKWVLNQHAEFNFAWAHAFDSTGSSGDLQDDGIHVQALYTF